MGEAADEAIDYWIFGSWRHYDDPQGSGDYDMLVAQEQHWRLQQHYRQLNAHIKSGGVSRDALALGMKLKAAGISKC